MYIHTYTQVPEVGELGAHRGQDARVSVAARQLLLVFSYCTLVLFVLVCYAIVYLSLFSLYVLCFVSTTRQLLLEDPLDKPAAYY